MSDWADTRKSEAYREFIADTIEVSKMVDTGKLSSTSGRLLFSEVYDKYQHNLAAIEFADAVLV